MSESNKYGLSRHIPSEIAKEVRIKSKFGCINCRCAIYQYEHILPEFKDAREHDAKNICLLCGRCHDKVTRGRLSKETVRRKYLEIQNSKDVPKPFENLDLDSSKINVRFGECSFELSEVLFHINGQDVLSILPPEEGAHFPTLNGVFSDKEGNELLSIDNNVWKSSESASDVIVKGRNVIIRINDDEIGLAFEVVPPNQILIHEMNLRKNNCEIQVAEGYLLVGQIHGNETTKLGIKFSCKGAETAISVNSEIPIERNKFGLSMIGGKGIEISGTGIKVGVGAGQMVIAELKVWEY